jgi:hypothetical protein
MKPLSQIVDTAVEELNGRGDTAPDFVSITILSAGLIIAEAIRDLAEDIRIRK